MKFNFNQLIIIKIYKDNIGGNKNEKRSKR